MTNFRDAVIMQMQKERAAKGYRWVFAKYNIFRAELRPSISLEEFTEKMKELCDEGIFVEQQGYTSKIDYCLTEKGERIVYR